MNKEAQLVLEELNEKHRNLDRTTLAELSDEVLIEITEHSFFGDAAIQELGKRKPNLFKLYFRFVIPRDSFIKLYKKAKGDIVFSQEETYNKELPVEEALELSDKLKEEQTLTEPIKKMVTELNEKLAVLASALQSMGLLENKPT